MPLTRVPAAKVASMDSLSVMTAANVIIESMIVNYEQIFSPEEVKQFRVSRTLTRVT